MTRALRAALRQALLLLAAAAALSAGRTGAASPGLTEVGRHSGGGRRRSEPTDLPQGGVGSAWWTEGTRGRAQRGHLTCGSCEDSRQVYWARSHKEEKSARGMGVGVVGVVRWMTNLGAVCSGGRECVCGCALVGSCVAA